MVIAVIKKRSHQETESQLPLFFAKKKINKHPINFYIFYEIDEQGAEHAYSLKNYHKEGQGNADYQYWVLLQEVKE